MHAVVLLSGPIVGVHGLRVCVPGVDSRELASGAEPLLHSVRRPRRLLVRRDGTYPVISQGKQALSKPALSMDVPADEEDGHEKREAKEQRPLDDLTRLQTCQRLIRTLSGMLRPRTRLYHQGMALPFSTTHPKGISLVVEVGVDVGTGTKVGVGMTASVGTGRAVSCRGSSAASTCTMVMDGPRWDRAW